MRPITCSWWVLNGNPPWLPQQAGRPDPVERAWGKITPPRNPRVLHQSDRNPIMQLLKDEASKRQTCNRGAVPFSVFFLERQADTRHHRHLNTTTELDDPAVQTKWVRQQPEWWNGSPGEIPWNKVPPPTADIEVWLRDMEGTVGAIPAYLGFSTTSIPGNISGSNIPHDSLVRTPFAAMTVCYNVQRYAGVPREMAYYISGTLSKDYQVPNREALPRLLRIWEYLAADESPHHLMAATKHFSLDKIKIIADVFGDDAALFLITLIRDYTFASTLDLQLDIAEYDNTHALKDWAIKGRGVHVKLGVGTGDCLQFDDGSCLNGSFTDLIRALYPAIIEQILRWRAIRALGINDGSLDHRRAFSADW